MVGNTYGILLSNTHLFDQRFLMVFDFATSARLSNIRAEHLLPYIHFKALLFEYIFNQLSGNTSNLLTCTTCERSASLLHERQYIIPPDLWIYDFLSR